MTKETESMEICGLDRAELCHSIIEDFHDPILFLDGQCLIRCANRAFRHLLGYSPQDTLGKPFLSLLPTSAVADISRLLSECLERKTGAYLEIQIVNSQGGCEIFETHVSTKVGDRHQPVLILHLRCITELRRERAANRELELLYQALVEQASDAFFVHDFEGRIIDVNHRACESLGYSRQELLCMSITDLEQDFDLTTAQAEWAKISPGAEFTLHGHHRRSNGTTFPVEVRFGCAERNGKRVFLGLVRDITASRQAEEKFQKIVEGAPDPIFIQADHRFVYLNPAACQLLGIKSAQELIGTPVIERVHPDNRDKVRERIRQLNEGRKPVNDLYEQRFLRQDGSAVWVETKGEPLDYEGSNGALVFVRDISARKEAEARLRREETFSKLIMDSLPIGIAVNSVFPDVEFVYMNDNFPRLYRTSREELANPDTFWESVYEDPGLRSQIKQRVLADIASGDPSRLLWENIPITRQGRETSYISAYNTPVPGENLMISTVIDVTERKQAEDAQRRNAERLEALHAELEQRVRERTAQLEAANRELEAFSYSVSHDLRAPLRAVDGYVQILLEDFGPHLDDEGKRVCDVISNSAKQMGKLIDDLLALSRVGRVMIQPSVTDMAGLAKSIYYELTSETERERIQFCVGNLPAAHGDPTLLRQVWMNLLDNAIKFSARKQDTVIEVGARQEGDATVYSVKDRGAGFDMRYADKLFGVFQRLHSSQEFEGTGVGLAIVQRIIHRHGGKVWAEGAPNEGATFYFSLRGLEDSARLRSD